MPWRLIGQLVDIRATATMVQIFHHGELVKTHVRKDKGRATDITDYPPEKAAGGPSYRTILAAGLEDIEADRPTGDAGPRSCTALPACSPTSSRFLPRPQPP